MQKRTFQICFAVQASTIQYNTLLTVNKPPLYITASRNLLVFKCNKDFFHCHIRRQVLSQGMGLGPSGGSRTHPPSPLKYGGLCFVMISLWMLLGNWGCGVHDTPRRQVLSQCMELGPNGGLRTHPPPFPH